MPAYPVSRNICATEECQGNDLKMATNFADLEKEALALSSREKATLARALIEALDSAVDAGAEKLWIEEAQRRYQAYKSGELEAASGEEAMQRARQRLK